MTVAMETKKIDCPHCKGPIDVEIERKPAKVHIEKQEEPQLAVSELDAAVEKALAKRAPAPAETKPEKKDEIVHPSHIKKYKCKGCGKLHDNPNFKGAPKGKCDTCGEKFGTKSKGKCPYCKDGEIEALDPEDVSELGLYAEDDDEEEEHEHE